MLRGIDLRSLWKLHVKRSLGKCSVNLSHFKLNINKSNWKHFTFEPGNPLFEKKRARAIVFVLERVGNSQIVPWFGISFKFINLQNRNSQVVNQDACFILKVKWSRHLTVAVALATVELLHSV